MRPSKVLLPDWSVPAVSAGYDAAEGDLLGGCHVTPAGFAHMTHMLSSLADGKLVLALEVSLSPPRCTCEKSDVQSSVSSPGRL